MHTAHQSGAVTKWLFDILIMCETKLNKKVKSSEFLPKNYVANCFRRDRDDHGGGVLIALKSHIVVDEVEILDINCEVVWDKVTLANSSPMYIGSYYRPPGNMDTISLENLEKSLDAITNKNNPRATYILAGDFNAGAINKIINNP